MTPEKLRATYVVARRDFVTVTRSKGFILFLLGPLFMIAVTAFTGNLGRAAAGAERPVIGLAMSAPDTAAMLAARAFLDDAIPGPVPEFTVIRRVAPGEHLDAAAELHAGKGQLAAVISGSLAAPVLTTTRERVEEWQDMVGLFAARAAHPAVVAITPVRAETVATSAAKQSLGQMATAEIGQTLLFLLTMMLATMVLSNLVEEKGNKIIEILAAAIPLESLFLGKLVAMLAVSFVAIAVWGSMVGVLFLAGAKALPVVAAPAVGWPLFAGLAVLYFAMAYMLLGSVYLAIGGIAATVRDIQTLALPASLLQVAMFFFASYALARQGTPVEWAAMAFPLSSPFAMVARGAIDSALWPHVLALGWQAGWTLLFISIGARLFRARVMKSGPAGSGGARRRQAVAQRD